MPRRRNTHEERDEALRLAKSADATERKAGIELLCKMYQPLVETLAGRYWQPLLGAEREELEQVAVVGLLEALQSFDVRLGTFSSHAQWQMRHALAEYIALLPNPVRIPSDLIRRMSKLRRLAAKFRQENGQEPQAADLCKPLGLSEAATATMLNYDLGPLELDAELKFDGNKPLLNPRKEFVVDRFLSDEPSPEEQFISKETIYAHLLGSNGNGNGAAHGDSPRRKRRRGSGDC